MKCPLVTPQLHTYVYIVPPPASVGQAPRSPSSLSSGRGSELTVDGAIRVSHSAGSGRNEQILYWLLNGIQQKFTTVGNFYNPAPARVDLEPLRIGMPAQFHHSLM